jgi:hypothetical protein
VFPVPRTCDADAIAAKLNLESAQLLVILPKPKVSSLPPPPPSSKDKHKEHKPPGRSQTLGELMRAGNGDGSPGSSSGSMWSAQEDPGKGKVEGKERREDTAVEEPRQDLQPMAAQDSARSGDGANEDGNKNDDGDAKGDDKRWWKKIRVIHVLGFVLVLALVGVGATLLYIVLL